MGFWTWEPEMPFMPIMDDPDFEQLCELRKENIRLKKKRDLLLLARENEGLINECAQLEREGSREGWATTSYTPKFDEGKKQ